MIERLAAEANSRLMLLRESEASVSEVQQALAARDESVRALAAEADYRLELLEAARTSLAHVAQRLLEAHEALDEKESVLRALHVEAELRLQPLLESDGERRLLEQKLAQIPAPDGA